MISKAKYVYNPLVGENTHVNIVFDGVEMTVPMNPKNMDYKRVLEWISLGNTPEPADTSANVSE